MAISKTTRAEDMEFGRKNEESTVGILTNIFGEEMSFNGRWDVLDWSNKTKTIWAELKSRRISVSDYETGIVGLNKVQSCTDPNLKYYFFFKYTDGLYYIKYKKALFDTFDTNMNYKRGERPDCSNNPSAVVYVPIRLLKRVANVVYEDKI